MKREHIFYICFSLILALILVSCSSSNVIKSISAEERFELGKTKFNNKDYLEAINEFEIIKLQFPGSTVAADAQYYLAECRFNLEEYLLAAMEYQNLKVNMPASSLVPLAQYKIGLCYYNLAPKSSLDQQYTRRAIEEFQAFIEYYPKHELVPDATAKIKELNDRLAKKIYDSAELYMKMEYFKSATIYYSNIVEKYFDTQYAEFALLGKVKSLIARHKYEEALPDLEKFLEKYPNSRLRKESELLLKEINSQVKQKNSTVEK